MSGIYYVFFKWANTSNNDLAAKWGRYLLCFPSRAVADDLFRAMQSLRARNNQGFYFTTLTRESPQFWVYDTAEHNGNALLLMQSHSELPSFRDKYSQLLLSDWDGRQWPMVPQSLTRNIETLSGSCFFIRNIRQPEMYWYVANDGSIVTTTTRRSKFRITKLGEELRAPVVLVRGDDVKVEVVGPRGGLMGSEPVEGALRVNEGWERGWRLGEVLGVGVEWEDSGREVLKVTRDGEGDEWELC